MYSLKINWNCGQLWSFSSWSCTALGINHNKLPNLTACIMQGMVIQCNGGVQDRPRLRQAILITRFFSDHYHRFWDLNQLLHLHFRKFVPSCSRDGSAHFWSR